MNGGELTRQNIDPIGAEIYDKLRSATRRDSGGAVLTRPLVGLMLSGPHMEVSARQAILQAVDTLEEENQRLHQQNHNVQSEVEHLRQENAQLRHELQQVRGDYDNMALSNTDLELERVKLREDYDRCRKIWSEEGQQLRELESLNNKYVQQLEQSKQLMSTKDRELQSSLRHLEKVTKQIENTSRKNFSERDVELMHEVALLKDEKKDIVHEKEELEKTNKKLRQEISNLQMSMAQKLAELKNENRRHSLLTKEFNSLLEENNNLKIQLRGRHTSRIESRQKADHTTETLHPVNRESSELLSAKRFGSMTSLLPREASFAPSRRSVSRDSSTASRDSSVMSREKTSLGRQVTLARANKTAIGSRSGGRPEGVSKHGPDDLSLGFISVYQSASAKSQSDVLPTIDTSGKTWKP